MTRWIGCVLLHCFAAAVERRSDRLLAFRPIILHHEGKVYGLSPEAIQAGVRMEMPLRSARALSPTAAILPAIPARYHVAFREVLQALWAFTERIEPGEGVRSRTHNRRKRTANLPFISEDGLSAVFYVDFETLHEAEVRILAQRISQVVREKCKLPVSIGVASGKFPARMAALLANDGSKFLVAPGNEASFLADLPVTLLPVDDEMMERLHLLGLRKLEQVTKLSAGAMFSQFGRVGTFAHHLANGQDTRPVIPQRPGATLQVARQLEPPVADRLVLEGILRQMVDQLVSRLRDQGQAARRIALDITWGSGKHIERQTTLRKLTNDPEQLTQTLYQFLTRSALRSGVSSVEITLSDLSPAVGRQLDLFSHETGQDTRLQDALKNVAARYGADCFYWISPAIEKARLPEHGYTWRQADGA